MGKSRLCAENVPKMLISIHFLRELLHYLPVWKSGENACFCQKNIKTLKKIVLNLIFKTEYYLSGGGYVSNLFNNIALILPVERYLWAQLYSPGGTGGRVDHLSEG